MEVYDIEILKGAFTYTGYDISTGTIKQFVIHKDKNELSEMMAHLRSLRWQVGFNNVNFDYPIIHHIIRNYYSLRRLEPQSVIDIIYEKAQNIINTQSTSKHKVFHAINDRYCYIKQLDLFKIWHYDNKAKSTSLKALEIGMNYPDVMDMPIHYSTKEISISQLDSILEYNLNDVMATYEFYKKTIQYSKLDLRKSILQKYDLKCLNWNNGKIGEQLILKLYCDKTGKNPEEIRKMRSMRSEIALKDCIPAQISFKTKEFNEILKKFQNKVVNVASMKDAKKNNKVGTIIYKNCLINYGLGGVHGVCKAGVYESDDYWVIKSCDVASLYPWLPIVYRFWIEHLGPEFLEVYKDGIVDVRLAEKMKPKAEQDKAIVDGFKEAANIPYGKSNDINSFLYDPLYTMKTTVSGQLSTSMLCERLGEIPECTILMYNTDGLEIMIPRKYEELYDRLCKEWESETGLVLEFVDYKKMWIADINSYGALTTNNKIKNKNRFEVDKVIGNEPAYYKDNSFRIVPLALEKYFVEGIPVETTIQNHRNIYDFCGRQKFKGEDYGYTKTIINNKIINEKQQKNVRYYISNKGASFIKKYGKDESEEIINKGYLVTVFNKYLEMNWEEYNVDYSYYIAECYKEINSVVSNQLSLFD